MCNGRKWLVYYKKVIICDIIYLKHLKGFVLGELIMRIAIVDDQKEFLDIISRKIKPLRYPFDTYTSVNDVKGQYDLMLLDIDMPDCDGIGYAKKHRNQNIIFITTHSERVKEAFGSNVYGFIEKSDDDSVFEKIIENAMREIIDEKYITLKINQENKKFLIKDIIYIQYMRYKTVGFIYNDLSYIAKGYSLIDIEEQLENQFVYIDRTTLVNKDKMLRLINDRLYISGVPQIFTVSKRRKAEIKDLIVSYEGDM